MNVREGAMLGLIVGLAMAGCTVAQQQTGSGALIATEVKLCAEYQPRIAAGLASPDLSTSITAAYLDAKCKTIGPHDDPTSVQWIPEVAGVLKAVLPIVAAVL